MSKAKSLIRLVELAAAQEYEKKFLSAPNFGARKQLIIYAKASYEATAARQGLRAAAGVIDPKEYNKLIDLF